jgi:hypothetical protein
MLKKLGIVPPRFGQIWLYVPRYEIIPCLIIFLYFWLLTENQL